MQNVSNCSIHATFRILHWNFEPPLLISDTEKWGWTRMWKPKRIGVGRVKGGIKRETRAEMGVLKEWELGEISRNHATMLNILQLKKSWRQAKKNRLGGRKTMYRSWEVWATCPSQKRQMKNLDYRYYLTVKTFTALWIFWDLKIKHYG